MSSEEDSATTARAHAAAPSLLGVGVNCDGVVIARGTQCHPAHLQLFTVKASLFFNPSSFTSPCNFVAFYKDDGVACRLLLPLRDTRGSRLPAAAPQAVQQTLQVFGRGLVCLRCELLEAVLPALWPEHLPGPCVAYPFPPRWTLRTVSVLSAHQFRQQLLPPRFGTRVRGPFHPRLALPRTWEAEKMGRVRSGAVGLERGDKASGDIRRTEKPHRAALLWVRGMKSLRVWGKEGGVNEATSVKYKQQRRRGGGWGETTKV